MPKLLVPVDGSPAAQRAVEHVIEEARKGRGCEIVLVNVQPPVDAWELKSHLKPEEIEAMQESRGGDALAPARRALDAAGIAYAPHVLLGPVPQTIVAFAREQGCEGIVMGNKGESFLEEAVIGSVAHEVLRISPLPVTFVK